MGIATAIDEAVTNLTNVYATDFSVALTHTLQPVAVLAVTIYLFFQGWAILRGHVSDTLPTLLMRAFRIAFIATLALAEGNYQYYISGLVLGLQNLLIGTITAQPNMGAFMDQVIEDHFNLVADLLMRPSTSLFGLDIRLLLAAVLVLIGALGTVLVGMGYWCLTKVALTLLFAVGPLFIACAMFPNTQRFAESWLGQALNYVMLSVLVAACVAMFAGFGADYAATILAQKETLNALKSAATMFIATITLVVVMLNLSNIAAALTGGIGLAGVGREIAHAGVAAAAVYKRARPPRPLAQPASGGTISAAQPPLLSQAQPALYQRSMQLADRAPPNP